MLLTLSQSQLHGPGHLPPHCRGQQNRSCRPAVLMFFLVADPDSGFSRRFAAAVEDGSDPDLERLPVTLGVSCLDSDDCTAAVIIEKAAVVSCDTIHGAEHNKNALIAEGVPLLRGRDLNRATSGL